MVIRINTVFISRHGMFDNTMDCSKAGYAAQTDPIRSLQTDPSFGMMMPGRQYNSTGYNYGFNGKLKDDEVKGAGNSYDFGARIYDSRLGRWLSIDKLQHKYPDQAPYGFGLENPICFMDGDGNEVIDRNGKKVTVFVSQNDDGSYCADYKFTEGTKQHVIDDFEKNAGRLIKTIIQSETGRDQLKKVIDSKDKIHTTIDNATKIRKGKIVNGETEVVPKSEFHEEYIQVSIHEGSIKETEANTRRKDLKQDENSEGNNWVKNKLSPEQEAASTAGHEWEHATDQEHINGLRAGKTISKDDPKHKSAYGKGAKIANELGSKNQKSKEKVVN